MRKAFSTTWKSSVQPRKQRKYSYNAPKHTVGRFMRSSLSKELRQRYQLRSLRVRKGDTVKIMRGQFKGKQGKVDRADAKNRRIFIEKIEVGKKDGSKALFPIDPTNVQITELGSDDKKRLNEPKGESK